MNHHRHRQRNRNRNRNRNHNHHHHHPPPPLIRCQATTTQILKQTNTIIFSKRHHFFISLILSLLLFSFQTSAQTIIHSLTSAIDNDPSLKAYYRHLQKPPNPLTADEQLYRRYFEITPPKPQPNATPLILSSFNPQMGFSSFISDHGITLSEAVHSGVNFSLRSFEKQENESSTVRDDDDDKKSSSSYVGTAVMASYTFENLGFMVTQSCVNGILFVLIVNHFLKIDHSQSLMQVFRKGAYLGFRRLSWFNETRYLIRVAFTRILAKFISGDIKDPYTRYKYFMKLVFMPYSQRLLWVEGFEKKIYGFLYSWFLFEMLVSCVFTVFASVCLADWVKSDMEVIREGFRLLSLRKCPAIVLKSLECIVWRSVAAILTPFFGEMFASFVQCFIEVYFMVAWIVYYFAVMLVDANSRGVPFGQERELEAMLIEI